MCGRYGIDATPDIIEQMLSVKILEPFDLRSNIAPSQDVLCITQVDNSAAVVKSWGFKPSWMTSGLLINAKSETVDSKPTFRDSFLNRRCVVPATCFYEWRKLDGAKLPFAFSLEQEIFLLAAIFTESDEVVILTTTPNQVVEKYHNRMPVILTIDNFRDWLDNPSSSWSTPFSGNMLVEQRSPLQ